MGRRLYVANLPPSIEQLALEKVFGQCGTVESVNIVTDRATGYSKGFGFVDMSSDAEAQKAIEQLNGADCEGQPLTVNEAKPQKKRKSGFGGGRR